MLPKISIIILNWNGLSDTLECLESIQRIDYPNYEVILVDNNSTGNDVIDIKKRFGNFISKIIINSENVGFSGGNNAGIEFALKTNSEAVLLLNNDTIVEPNFLLKLVEAANSNPQVGILTPLINYYYEKNKVWFAGGYISKFRSTGIPIGIGKPESLYTNNFNCTFASGCCMYIKKEVFKKIGFLDSNYFLYLEDSDFSYRGILADYNILFVADSKIYHKVSATTNRKDSLLTLYYSTRNRIYFAKKNLHAGYFYHILLFLIATIPFKLLWMKRKKDAFKIFSKSVADGLNNKMFRNEEL